MIEMVDERGDSESPVTFDVTVREYAVAYDSGVRLLRTGGSTEADPLLEGPGAG